MAPTQLQLAAALIESYEGLRLTAYQDTRGIWTVGFGSTSIGGKPVVKGQTITQEQAEAALSDYLSAALPMVGGRPLIEQAALLDFAYNCGVGALHRVLASEHLPPGDAMKVNLLDFDHEGGQVSEALARRRRVEWLLILASRAV